MGITELHPFPPEQEIRKQMHDEKLLENLNFKKASKFLLFVSNLSLIKINLRRQAKLQTCIFTLLKIRKIKCLILHNLTLSKDAIIDLSEGIFHQKALEFIYLSFDVPKDRTVLISQIITELVNCKNLKRVYLNNWAKKGLVMVDGNAVAGLIKESQLKEFQIRKIMITNFDTFVGSFRLNNSLKKVCIQSDDEFKKIEVAALYKALATNHNLKKIEILDKYSSPQIAWEEYIELIEASDKLTSVTLKENDEMPLKVYTSLLRSLDKNASLRVFTFKGFSKNSTRFSELLGKLNRHLLLEILDISGNQLNSLNVIDKLKSIIDLCPNLHGLNFSETIINNSPSLAPLLKIISEKYNINSLDFSGNSYNFPNFEELCKLVSRIKNLHKLYIKNCNLTDDFLKLLFDSLKINLNLQYIDLRNQGNAQSIKNSSESLVSLLKNNTNFIEFHLSGSTCDQTKIEDILQSISTSSLKSLDLTGIGLSESSFNFFSQKIHNMTSMKNFKLFDKGIIDYSTFFGNINKCKSLISAEIQCDNFSIKSIEILGEELKKFYSLSILKISGIISPGGINFLNKGLSQNQSLHYLALFKSDIKEEEIMHLFTFLERNRSIESYYLYMGVFELHDGIITSITRSAKNYKKLRVLGVCEGKATKTGLDRLRRVRKKAFWLLIETF